MNLEYKKVPHYESRFDICGLTVEAVASTVYQYTDFDGEFQEVTYDFDVDVDGLLIEFREEEVFELGGEKVYPILVGFSEYSSVSFLLPIDDRVEAAEFTDSVAAELEEFMEGYGVHNPKL